MEFLNLLLVVIILGIIGLILNVVFLLNKEDRINFINKIKSKLNLGGI